MIICHFKDIYLLTATQPDTHNEAQVNSINASLAEHCIAHKLDM